MKDGMKIINSWFLSVWFVSSEHQSVPVACLEIFITSSSQGLYLIRLLMSISSNGGTSSRSEM